MRYLLALGIALFAGSLAQAQCFRERGPLFPRLHALLHPQPCVPCCPPVAEPKPEPPKKVESTAAGYEYVTIRGRVYWPGDTAIPDLKIVNNGPKPIPGFGPVTLNDLLIEPSNRGIKNIIVWLRPDDEDRIKTFPLDKVKPDLRKVSTPVTYTIGIKDGNFEPRCLAARAGDQFRFVNNSTTPINLNYSSDIESGVTILLPGQQTRLTKPLEAQRLPCLFSCNVFPWLQGRAKVFDHPYYAVTDKDGRFEIKDVPAGRWRIVYLHEQGYHKGKTGLFGYPIDVTPDKPVFDIDPVGYRSPVPPK